MEGRIDAGIFVGIDNDEPLIDELTDLGMIVGLFDYYHEMKILITGLQSTLSETPAKNY